MKLPSLVLAFASVLCGLAADGLAATPAAQSRHNVLFIISDDLTATALSCYGNTVVKTPNIDALAARGTRFTRAYCNGTYCGPSRASFMSGYYPHATGVLGYTNPRPQIGDRATWSQHFIKAGYYAARVSKIFHMGVPGGIEEGGDGRDHDGGNGADDAASWTERFNSPGPEWKAAGTG
jgi:iduronate 2-sulfatase